MSPRALVARRAPVSASVAIGPCPDQAAGTSAGASAPRCSAKQASAAARSNRGPLPDEELATIYTAILASMRRLQSPDLLERE